MANAPVHGEMGQQHEGGGLSWERRCCREFPLPPVWDIISISFTSIVGIIALGAAVEGYLKNSLSIPVRLILAAGALMMIIPETFSDIAGMVVVGLVGAWNWHSARQAATS